MFHAVGLRTNDVGNVFGTAWLDSEPRIDAMPAMRATLSIAYQGTSPNVWIASLLTSTPRAAAAIV